MKLMEILPPDPMTITFHGGSKLSFYSDGRCTFEGNADEAAKLFYEHLAKVHLDITTATLTPKVKNGRED